MSTNYVSFECVHITDTDRNNPDEKHAIAYADIDGYPSDINKEGTVICRVWLLREPVDIMNNKGFIVDWHHNGYRTTEAVIACINRAKEDLKKYADDIVEHIFNRAYSKYKLKWMVDNNISIKELLDKLQAGLDSGAKDIYDALADFEIGKLDYFETTIDGVSTYDIWKDEEGFRNHEWGDENYMKDLLSGVDYEIWYENRKKKKAEIPTRFPGL